MIEALVALAEYCFTDNFDGSRRKYNVKIQIQSVLENDKTTTTQRIADVLLDDMVEQVVTNNTKSQLI